MTKILFLFFVSIFLLSCQNLSYKSNVDPYVKNKVQHSIRASVVEEYSNNEVWKLNGKNLGVVENEFCQQRNISDGNGRVVLPSDKLLQDSLKADTQLLGGNGIVYDTCFNSVNYMGCDQYKRCRATAFLIEY